MSVQLDCIDLFERQPTPVPAPVKGLSKPLAGPVAAVLARPAPGRGYIRGLAAPKRGAPESGRGCSNSCASCKRATVMYELIRAIFWRVGWGSGRVLWLPILLTAAGPGAGYIFIMWIWRLVSRTPLPLAAPHGVG
ncbi:hypothetical protein BW247_12410 [Acidihalobacter ferrooxydans]|uniref:Uncharacterized protein n=1 Tax=Acidihalobacter ferrooxydans TaxID=1765967 RepID=A0A1P8UIY5_9GAMM|nr:hypothetical protein BW247_12410 [Acidihalobacter ferrooxydans]